MTKNVVFFLFFFAMKSNIEITIRFSVISLNLSILLALIAHNDLCNPSKKCFIFLRPF